jgi:hypothetical protein
MKKFFAIFAVVMFAVAANAEVLFNETMQTRRGSSYITKTDKGYWPYASQWFEGYDQVTGNQFDNDYDAVASYTVSVRGKKLDGATESSVGLYFGATKDADQNYVRFEGALPTVAEGDLLKFLVTSTEAPGGDLETMIVKVNGEELAVPSTTLGDQYATTEVAIALPAGEIESIEFAFNQVPSQKFIPRFWIEEAPAEGIENIMLTEKAHKMVVDGVVYIVRDGKMFNLTGTQVR